MEEAAELGDYLPLSFNRPNEQGYVAFLWDAFETNYTHGKYQFAFLAYHMLTMSFVYFNIWQIKKTEPQNFEVSLIGFGKDVEKKLLAATSPFVFHIVNERTILRFLKLLPATTPRSAPTPSWWMIETKPPTQTATSSSALSRLGQKDL